MFSFMYSHFHINSFSHVCKILVIVSGIIKINYKKNYLSIIIGGTQIITNKRKTRLFYKTIHFSLQFSALVNRFILKT